MKPLLFLLALFAFFLAAFVLQAQPNVGAVRGTIVDSTGKPVAGLIVILDRIGHVITKVDGTYLLSGIPSGEHQLQISLPGSDSAIHQSSIMIQDGDTTVKTATLYGQTLRFDLTRIDLIRDTTLCGIMGRPAPGILEGRILDEECEGITGAIVEIVGTSFGARAEPNGTFRLSGLRRGTYTVRISSSGRKPIELDQVTISPDAPTVIEVQLQRKEGVEEPFQLRCGGSPGYPLIDPLISGSGRTFTREEIIWK